MFAATSSFITASRDAHDVHAFGAGDVADTDDNDQRSSPEINTPRRARHHPQPGEYPGQSAVSVTG
jgi:hypothetical protein